MNLQAIGLLVIGLGIINLHKIPESIRQGVGTWNHVPRSARLTRPDA